MKEYNIAGIIIQLKFIFAEERAKIWEKFLTSDEVFHFEVSILSPFFNQYGIKGEKLYKDSGQYYFSFENDSMVVDNNWKYAQVVSLTKRNNFESLVLLIFHTHAVQRHMIQIHSAMIDYQGKGLLFLGPSGIGKTTMAELWNKYRDALIINGDMNFVQETEDSFLGWGTPWHGSSPYCENTNVPVHALIVLKQASENSIRELKNFEKVHLVSNNIIYPTWLENGMELCLETLDHLLKKIPVYELSCRPDEDAVCLTEETIFGKLAI